MCRKLLSQLILWVKRHIFFLGTLIAWMILCVPQNVVTLVMYFSQDVQDVQESSIPTNYSSNYSCFDEHATLKSKFKFGVRGVTTIIIGITGIIGNVFSIIVLRRLATKSEFNRLLLSLGINYRNCVFQLFFVY